MAIDFSLITKIAVFLINAVGFWLIFVVYFADVTKKIKRAFILMTLCMLVWVNFAYIARLPSQMDLAIFWIKIAWAVTIPLFASLYFFTVSFVEKKERVKALNLTVLIIGISSFFITLLTDWVIKDILSKQVWTKLVYGHGIAVFYGLVLFLSFLTLNLLFRKYFISSKKEKLKTQYLLIGIVFFLFMNVVFNIVYPFLLGISNYYQLGDYSTIVSISFIAYAVTRRELMGIKIILTQALVAVITIILLLDIFALSHDLTMQILKAGILITLLYLSREIVKSVGKEKQAREELQKTYKRINRYVKKLEKANLDLEELLEAKNDFLHITSHQLRTPLTVIRGMLAMWKAGDFEQLSRKKQKEMRERIYLSAERLNNVTNDMLDAMEVESKFVKFNLESVSLENLMKKVMDELKPNYDKKELYLKLNVKSKLPKIKAEPKYLKQALINLLDNAEKYTLKGGVEISIDLKVSGKNKEDKFVLIKIKDTGIGINKREQKKLFQKFSRAKNAMKQNVTGSGLGLFIAKEIIEEHQGKIELSSEGAGKGTTVKVWLPRK